MCSGPCRPLVAECAGELAAEPCVLVGELPVAVEGGGEPGPQRRIGGPLGGGDAAGGAGGFVSCRSLWIWLLMSGWV